MINGISTDKTSVICGNLKRSRIHVPRFFVSLVRATRVKVTMDQSWKVFFGQVRLRFLTFFCREMLSGISRVKFYCY